MQPELFTIRRTGPGVLSTMARPHGGQWLQAGMNGLAEAGVGVLVSLLSEAEMDELGLLSEAAAARASGIAFYHLPTQDRTVPDHAAGLELAETLRTLLAQGAGVAIHCRYGIGRSSTLAAMVMVLEGTEPEQAWTLISAARGTTVPDTVAQREAIARLATLSPREPKGCGTASH
jgi:protein-tyrosine phosphatase